MAALYSVLLVSAALTISAVFGPVIVNPLPGFKFFMKEVPLRLVMVSATVTLVTPAAELAVKDRVLEAWNWRDPSGEIAVMVGAAWTKWQQNSINKMAVQRTALVKCGIG